MDSARGLEEQPAGRSLNDDDDCDVRESDDDPNRCLACHDLIVVPGPSGGYIGQIEYQQLEASAKSCMYCSILLEGLANFVPDVGQVKRVMALRPEHDTELFSLRYIFNEGDNFGWNCLQFYVDSNDSPLVEVFKPGQDLATKTDCSDYLEEMESWVSTCNLNHPICNERDLYLPTRVLDVLRDDEHVFLCDGRDFRAGQEHYCALSHCWGGMVPIRTTTSTIEGFRKGIALASLPKTFREAVLVTRRLRCRFLWIDSLCIIQDSVEDWKRESIQMGEVYGNAHVTIAATDSANSEGGLFYHHEPNEVKYTVKRQLKNGLLALIRVRPAIDHGSYFQNNVQLGTNAPRVPLLERCWCFQEYILSPRVISFTKWELMWECRHTTACHCNIGTHDRNRPGMEASNMKALYHSQINSLSLREFEELWGKISWVYSQKKITFEKDKLPAISAIAKQFMNRSFGKHICGLWEKTLTSDLFWQLQPPNIDPNAIWAVTRVAASLLPSWSWMSVNGPTEFKLAPYIGGVSIAEIKLIDVGLSDLESLTSVAARELLIRARITEAIVSIGDYPSDVAAGLIDMSLKSDFKKILWRPDVLSECINSSQDESKQVSIMWGLGKTLLDEASIKTGETEHGSIETASGGRNLSGRDRFPFNASGIVLERVMDNNEDGIATYKRLGSCEFPHVERGRGWEQIAHMEPTLFRLI